MVLDFDTTSGDITQARLVTMVNSGPHSLQDIQKSSVAKTNYENSQKRIHVSYDA